MASLGGSARVSGFPGPRIPVHKSGRRPEIHELTNALDRLPWTDIKRMAIQLKVELSSLDNIELERPVARERALYAMKEWLNNDTEASWAKVVDALRNISEKIVAKEIEEKYCSPGAENSTPSASSHANTRHGASNMESKFVALLARTKSYFQEREEKSGHFLGRLKTMLTMLPQSSRHEHSFLRHEKDRIESAPDVDEIFDILKPYWNYSDYALLECIVAEFGSVRLRKRMREYISNLETFEKSTTIQEVSSMRKFRIPAHFKRVKIIQGKDPVKCTLHELRLFHEDIANRAALERYAVSREYTIVHSIEIVLAFPPEAFKDMQQVFDEEFKRKYEILSVSFSDTKGSVTAEAKAPVPYPEDSPKGETDMSSTSRPMTSPEVHAPSEQVEEETHRHQTPQSTGSALGTTGLRPYRAAVVVHDRSGTTSGKVTRASEEQVGQQLIPPDHRDEPGYGATEQGTSGGGRMRPRVCLPVSCYLCLCSLLLSLFILSLFLCSSFGVYFIELYRNLECETYDIIPAGGSIECGTASSLQYSRITLLAVQESGDTGLSEIQAWLTKDKDMTFYSEFQQPFIGRGIVSDRKQVLLNGSQIYTWKGSVIYGYCCITNHGTTEQTASLYIFTSDEDANNFISGQGTRNAILSDKMRVPPAHGDLEPHCFSKWGSDAPFNVKNNSYHFIGVDIPENSTYSSNVTVLLVNVNTSDYGMPHKFANTSTSLSLSGKPFSTTNYVAICAAQSLTSDSEAYPMEKATHILSCNEPHRWMKIVFPIALAVGLCLFVIVCIAISCICCRKCLKGRQGPCCHPCRWCRHYRPLSVHK